MRITTPIIAAAALLAATPVIAQNDAAAPDANAEMAVNAVDANAMTPTDNAAMAGDQTAVVPVDNTAAMDANTAPPVQEKHGFPWGLLGLLGLLGFIPRTRRNNNS